MSTRLKPLTGSKELLRASIGQIFYLASPKVYLSDLAPLIPHFRQSHLFAQAEFHSHQRWSGGVFWEWDPKYQVTEQAGLSLQYHHEHQQLVNFNYYWLKHDLAQATTGQVLSGLHQAELAFFWPLSPRWQAITRWHYDLQQRQSIELLGGLEYNGCCLAFQVIASRYRQSSNAFLPTYATGVFAQIVFKGLSAVGVNNPDGRLKEKISGYIPLAQRQARAIPRQGK